MRPIRNPASELGRPDSDRVLAGRQPQLRLRLPMSLPGFFFPVKTPVRVRPCHLQDRERSPSVEPNGPPEEGSVPAKIDPPESDLPTVDDAPMLLAVSQDRARRGHLAKPVEHAVHDVDIEPEHCKLRCTVRVGQTDRVSKPRADLILGDHHHVPSVVLYVADDRLLNLICLRPVTVVMAQDTAALEWITGHAWRVRGERSSRATGQPGP